MSTILHPAGFDRPATPAWDLPRNSVADYIEAAVSPYVPKELISPQALSAICGVAATLPGALTDFFGFECQLGNVDPAADFLVCSRTEQGGREVLAGRKPDRDLDASFLAHPVWKQIRAFAEDWSDPKSPCFESIHNVWLEFDIDGKHAPIPVPSVFIGSDSCTPPVRSIDIHNMPDHCSWLTRKVLATLLSRPIEGAIESQVARCVNLLPNSAKVFQTGVMLARTSRVIRLCVRGLAPDQILTYLRSVGWRGDDAEVERTVDALREFAARIDLDVDVADSVLPKIGLECYLRPDDLRTSNVAVFSDYLIASGLATPAKALALRQWRGLAHERYTPDIWPRELLGISGFLGGRVHSVFMRWLHHVKIVCQPDLPQQAKAYLAVQHGWLAPEALKGMLGEQIQMREAEA